jgi:hypothetical protein
MHPMPMPLTVSSQSLLVSLLAMCLLPCAASVRADGDPPQCRILPADASIQQKGQVLENGAFTLWDGGIIGDHVIVPNDRTVRVRVHAAAQPQNSVPAQLAVDAQPINGPPVRLGVLEVHSNRFSYRGDCDYADYDASGSLREGYYAIRITHLNRTVEEGKWRHCFVAALEIEGATRAECSPAAYAFFRQANFSRSNRGRSEARVVETEYLSVEVSPETACWSALQRRSGNRARGIHPAFRISGLPVDLSTYRVDFVRQRVRDKAVGDAIEVTMRYSKPDELDITYCLVISRSAGELVT